MKTAKLGTEAHEDKSAGHRRKIAAIPAEARRSTAAALLKHAPGWTGNDLEDVIATVTGTPDEDAVLMAYLLDTNHCF